MAQSSKGINLVTVMPLERGVWTDTLSYFSSRELPIGTIVMVPLRKKIIPALVMSVRPAAEEKALIKSSKMGLRKILQVVHTNPFGEDLIKTAEETARFYATTTGTVLASLIPTALIKSAPKEQPKIPSNTSHTIQIMQTDDEERFARYRLIVRESFRHGESVLCLVPTIQDAEKVFALLSKGIEEYSVTLNSDRKTKEVLASLKKLHSASHPLLIVSTPGFLALTLPHASVLVMERENSPAYKQLVRPFIDFRFVVKTFSRIAKKRLVLGDILLSLETMHTYQTQQIDELIPPKWRIDEKAKIVLADMRIYKPDLKGKVKAVSDELSDLIKNTRASNERTFIFTSRKGVAPATICGDCGSLLLCDVCEHSVVLHRTAGDKRFYLCHRCGNKMSVERRCKLCTSWKLVTLGIGTELIENELLSLFPDLMVIRLDRESAKDRKQALELIEKFYKNPGSVLVGTELSIPYLTKPISAVAVASVDELFSIPDFRINERIAYLLYKLVSIAEQRFVLQTRTPENSAVLSILEGNINTLFSNEMSMRKALLYPPFSVPIKITWFGKPETLKDQMQELAKKILPFTLDIFPLLEKYPKGKIGLSGVVKIPYQKWPDENVLNILRSLPPSAEINVDPMSFT